MKLPFILAAATLAASAFAAVPGSAATLGSPLPDAPSGFQTVAYHRIIPPNGGQGQRFTGGNRFEGGQRFMDNRSGDRRDFAYRSDDRWRDRGDRWHNRWGWGGPSVAFGFGSDYVEPGYGYDYNTYDSYRVAGIDGNHVQYCLDRYRSYDPASNTFMGYDGMRHECVAPY